MGIILLSMSDEETNCQFVCVECNHPIGELLNNTTHSGNINLNVCVWIVSYTSKS